MIIRKAWFTLLGETERFEAYTDGWVNDWPRVYLTRPQAEAFAAAAGEHSPLYLAADGALLLPEADFRAEPTQHPDVGEVYLMTGFHFVEVLS